MPIPIIAAGVAARVVAKKIATRAVGGITGRGAKTVNPVYQNVRATTDAIQKNSVKIKKTQAQINSEGAAKARAAMGLPPKPTAQEIAARSSREKIALMRSRIKRGN
jgi:hypothetical protein